MNIEFAFESLEQFFVMKGHGQYVWASYAIAFGVIALLSFIPVSRCRGFIKSQKNVIARDELEQVND